MSWYSLFFLRKKIKEKINKKREQIEYNNTYAEGRAFGEKGYRSKKIYINCTGSVIR